MRDTQTHLTSSFVLHGITFKGLILKSVTQHAQLFGGVGFLGKADACFDPEIPPDLLPGGQ